MQITFSINDDVAFDMSKTVNVPFLVDRAFKEIRSEVVEYIQHVRKSLSAFEFWYNKLNPAEQVHVRKNISSSIPVEECVPEGTQNRELIIEAIERYRKSQSNDGDKNDQASSTPTSPEGPAQQ